MGLLSFKDRVANQLRETSIRNVVTDNILDFGIVCRNAVADNYHVGVDIDQVRNRIALKESYPRLLQHVADGWIDSTVTAEYRKAEFLKITRRRSHACARNADEIQRGIDATLGRV